MRRPWPSPCSAACGATAGVTIIEFAMILPVLLLLLLGLFDLGYRSYASSVLQGALHEAARMATVGDVQHDPDRRAGAHAAVQLRDALDDHDRRRRAITNSPASRQPEKIAQRYRRRSTATIPATASRT